MLRFLILGFWIAALLRTILNLLLVPRLRARLPRRFPRVAVIIPARNEERVIEHTVRAMLAQTYPALEVIVVDDRSEDATGAILRSIDDPRLRVVHGEEPRAGWLGKPWALAQGSAHASPDVELLLFVDADVHYEPDAIAAAVAHFEESGAAMITLFPHFIMRGFWEQVAMPNLAITAYTLLPLWLTNRTRIPLLGIGGGPGNLIRRDVYEAIGGHERLKGAVVDDIGLARVVRRAGRATECVLANDFVSLRMYHGLREIIDGFTKNLFASLERSYILVLASAVLAIGCHFWPYAGALMGDRIAIATVILISLTRLILFLALRFRIDNAFLGHPLMMAVWGWIVVRSVWLTGIRRQVAWRGRTYDARETR